MGCRTFFVASITEASSISRRINSAGGRINVFNGVRPQTAEQYTDLGVTPVLNSLEEIAVWSRSGKSQDAAIHLDTGFNRLGFSNHDAADVSAFMASLPFPVSLVMSHLAGADRMSSTSPERQLNRFLERTHGAKNVMLSIANSAAVFRSPSFHLDLVRPGLALYGAQPILDKFMPLRPVSTFLAPILQTRDLSPGDEVGYGGTFVAERPMRVAVFGAGYADGVPLGLSNRGVIWIDGIQCPIIGRVSMDSLVADVTEVSDRSAQPGKWAEIFGNEISIDHQAHSAGAIAYELLCRVGGRTHVKYTEAT